MRATALKLDLRAVARTDHRTAASQPVRTGDGSRDAAPIPCPSDARTAAALSAAAVLALAGMLFFFHLGRYGLWEPDEARYAEVAREMLASGNYIVPHLNYVPYVEKPPMLYWTCALALRLFGINEFAARFINALSALIGVAATFYFTLRAFDWRRASLAGLVLVTSVLYALMAQVITTDMLLTASIAVALFTGWLQWRDGGRWRWLFYTAMGFGILVKGPIAAALPIVILLVYGWWEGDLRRTLIRFRPVSGLLLTFAIAAPWFIAIAIRQPDFIRYYVVSEHLRRFFQSGYSHHQPIYYYVPIPGRDATVDFGNSSPAVGLAPSQPGAEVLPNRRRNYLRGFLARQRQADSLHLARAAPARRGNRGWAGWRP